MGRVRPCKQQAFAMGVCLCALCVFSLVQYGGSRRSSALAPTPTSANSLLVISVPPSGQLYHAVYPGGRSGEEDDITLDDLHTYEQLVGKPAAWVYFSHNWFRD